MKNSKVFIISLCFIVFEIFTFNCLATDQVVIATSGDYAPANMSDDLCAKAVGAVVKTNNNHTVCGFEVDLMKQVCEVRKLNCVWTLEPFAWTEQNPNFPGILNNLFSASRSYDLVIAYLRGNAERMEKLTASASYIEGHPTMYKSAKLPVSTVQKNKKGFPVSKTDGTKIKIAASGSYVTEITSPEMAYYTAKELKDIEVVSIDSLEDQIKQLSSGEVDFAYGPNISASEFVAKKHFSFLEVPQLENSVEVGSRVFAAKDARGQNLIDHVNEGLFELWKSGEYQKIFDQYHIYDSWGEQNGPKE